MKKNKTSGLCWVSRAVLRTAAGCWLVLTLLVFAGSLSAQSASAKKQVSVIEQARELRTSDPDQAISLLNKAMSSKQQKVDLAEAFVLLGDIYADIGQHELAINRYNQALNTGLLTTKVARAEVYFKRGQSFQALQQLTAAAESYQVCLSIVDSSSNLGLACQEGLADVATARSEFELGQQLYTNVQQYDTSNQLRQSRVAAKRATNYAQGNDVVNAREQYQVAIEKLPPAKDLKLADYQDVIAANTNLNAVVVPKKIPGTETVVTPKEAPSGKELPAPLVISDQLARFEQSKTTDPAIAATYLNNALAAVDESVPAELATQLYREGTGFYLARRQPEKAAEFYQELLDVSNELLAEQRDELAQQANILKEQQTIDLVLKDQQSEVRERSLLGQQIELQRWLIFTLGALLLGALLSVFLILRNVRKRRRANQELLLRSLQTQMNPHFIFNSLNSINNYIAKRDERSANRFLGRFAKLMRNVLDQSGKTFVPVAEEIDQLRLYLELEEQRFAGKFSYDIEVNDAHKRNQELEIPPMLIQPFVENAIWHGLRYLPEKGNLLVRFDYPETGLQVTIRDNGIGRAKSTELKTDNQKKHRSTGLKNTQQRVELINHLYQQSITVSIEDAVPGTEFVGTEVVLNFGTKT